MGKVNQHYITLSFPIPQFSLEPNRDQRENKLKQNSKLIIELEKKIHQRQKIQRSNNKIAHKIEKWWRWTHRFCPGVVVSTVKSGSGFVAAIKIKYLPERREEGKGRGQKWNSENFRQKVWGKRETGQTNKNGKEKQPLLQPHAPNDGIDRHVSSTCWSNRLLTWRVFLNCAALKLRRWVDVVVLSVF